MFKTQFAFSIFVLLFMLQLVMQLESAPTTKLTTSSKNRTKRAVSTTNFEPWDDGIVSYAIQSTNQTQTCLIESAMMQIMLQSCVLFRPVQDTIRNQPDFVIKSINCGAPLHRVTRTTRLTLLDDCFNFGGLLHQLMGILGFGLEHQRSDRDQYLRINYLNFKNPSMIPYFDKKNAANEKILTPFDIDSILMYGPVTGSRDPALLKTIESKVPGKQVVSPDQKLSLSSLDVRAINEFYKCPLIDSKVCEKLNLFESYISYCGDQARNYLKLSLIKRLIDQCKRMNQENYY